MRFSDISVCSVAAVDAPQALSSSDIEARLGPAMRRLGLPRGMIESLSGVASRRLFAPGTQPSDAAAWAGRLALERAGIAPERVGLLINTSVCRDFIEPSTACIVHEKLGLSASCLNFDLGNACLGFVNGMVVAALMIAQGQIEYALVVDGEDSRFVLDATIARLNGEGTTHADITAHFATLTLGSGAAAMVLGRRTPRDQGPSFRGAVTLAATEHRELCRGQVDHMLTQPKGLLEAGIALAVRTFARAREELGWSREVLDELVLHQVSRTHTEGLLRALELDPARALSVYPELGNVGPAALPIVLSRALEAGRIAPGARVALMGIGSGLNCAMAEIAW